MAKSIHEWLAGPLFYFNNRGADGRQGGTNNESNKKQFGRAAKKGRGRGNKYRFNAQLTKVDHPNCQLSAQARRDAEAYKDRMKAGNTPKIIFKSKAQGMFHEFSDRL